MHMTSTDHTTSCGFDFYHKGSILYFLTNFYLSLMSSTRSNKTQNLQNLTMVSNVVISPL